MSQTDTHFWDTLAVKCYRDLLQREPENTLLLKNLGLAYARLGDPAKAITTLRKVVRLQKDHAEAHYHLGVLYEKQGRRSDAIRCFNRYHKHHRPTRADTGVVEQMLDRLVKEEASA